MSFFNSILQKLGLAKEEKPAEKPAAPVAAPAKPAAPAAPAAAAAAKPAEPVKAAEPVFVPTENFHPNAISVVNVVEKLEQMAAGSDFNWKVSIVDLLKILGIDSSREARNELAKELGCPEDLMHDSAKMNVWLHKEVLKKIAQNGGNIPADMLN